MATDAEDPKRVDELLAKDAVHAFNERVLRLMSETRANEVAEILAGQDSLVRGLDNNVNNNKGM